MKDSPGDDESCGSLALTTDLWSRILACLSTDHPDDRSRESSWKQTECISDIQELLNVRLVCKLFNTLHVRQVCGLSLPEALSSIAVPGLLSWLRRSKVSISIFEASHDSPFLNTVLSALADLKMPLETTACSSFGQSTLEILQSFSSLVQCALCSDIGTVLRL